MILSNRFACIAILAVGIMIVVCVVPVTADEHYGYYFGWGVLGTGNSQFSWPKGICTDLTGNVYVVDQLNNRIQVFTPEGGYKNQWGTFGSGNGQFDWPVGIAIDRVRVYIADTGNHRIQVFTLNGKYLAQWGTKGTGPGQFDEPTEIAINSSGYIFVADSKNDRIQVFDPRFNYITEWGTSGSGNGQFIYPVGLAFNSSGYLFVADVWNGRIQVLNPQGEYVSQWNGENIGWFNIATVLAINSSDYIFLGDSNNHRVLVFDTNGKFITQWGTHGTDPGQYDWVGGITIKNPLAKVDNSPELIYTSDTANDRIQVFIREVIPIIQKITPNSGKSGNKNQMCIIKGKNFLKGAAVHLHREGFIDIQGKITGSPLSGTIMCAFNIPSSAAGNWDVIVVNPGEVEGILKDGFKVK